MILLKEMGKPLQKEFEYYLVHRDEIVALYRGRFVVIKDQEVKGDYGSEMEAICEAEKKYELGTFLVQQADADPESTTQVFHSRVAFS